MESLFCYWGISKEYYEQCSVFWMREDYFLCLFRFMTLADKTVLHLSIQCLILYLDFIIMDFWAHHKALVHVLLAVAALVTFLSLMSTYMWIHTNSSTDTVLWSEGPKLHTNMVIGVKEKSVRVSYQSTNAFNIFFVTVLFQRYLSEQQSSYNN